MTPDTTCPHCLNPIAVATQTQPLTTCPLCGGLLATAGSHVQPGLPDRAPGQPHAVQEGPPRAVTAVTGTALDLGTHDVDIRNAPPIPAVRRRTDLACPLV